MGKIINPNTGEELPITKYYPYKQPISIEKMTDKPPKLPLIIASERYHGNIEFQPVFGKITIKDPRMEDTKNE